MLVLAALVYVSRLALPVYEYESVLAARVYGLALARAYASASAAQPYELPWAEPK